LIASNAAKDEIKTTSLNPMGKLRDLDRIRTCALSDADLIMANFGLQIGLSFLFVAENLAENRGGRFQ